MQSQIAQCSKTKCLQQAFSVTEKTHCKLRNFTTFTRDIIWCEISGFTMCKTSPWQKTSPNASQQETYTNCWLYFSSRHIEIIWKHKGFLLLFLRQLLLPDPFVLLLPLSSQATAIIGRIRDIQNQWFHTCFGTIRIVQQFCVLQSMCATINQTHCMCKMKKKQTTKQVTSTHPQRCCMSLF